MRPLAALALLLVGCTPPAGSYSLFVIHNDDIKPLSTSGELGEPVASGTNINILTRLDPQTAVLSTQGEDGFSLDLSLLHADGTTTAGPNIPWLSSVPRWAEDARRMFFYDGPNLVDVDLEAGTVSQPAPLNDTATLLAVNADATRSLWNIRRENNNELLLMDGPHSTDPVIQAYSEGAFTQSAALAFSPDSSRLYNVGRNEQNQQVFGYTDLDTDEYTEIVGWGSAQLIERQGDRMLAIPTDNLAFYTMDPEPPGDEPIFSGAWPLSGANTTWGFSPDLAWVLWGTEMFDTAPGTFRYELRPLPDNSGGTDSANYVDIVRDVDWALRGAVVLD